MTHPVSEIRRLLSRYERALISFVAGMVRDAEGARDVVQEVFLAYVEGQRAGTAPLSDEDGHLEAWLFTVARRKAIDYFRKHSRVTAVEEFPEMVSEEMTPDEAATAADDLAWLHELVAELPLSQRRVVQLKFVEGMSYDAISKETGYSQGNVGFILHNSLRTLQRLAQQREARLRVMNSMP